MILISRSSSQGILICQACFSRLCISRFTTAAATIQAAKTRSVDIPVCIPALLATTPMIAGATMAPMLARNTKNPIQTGYLEKISPALETEVPNMPDMPRPIPAVAMINPAGDRFSRRRIINTVVMSVRARIM